MSKAPIAIALGISAALCFGTLASGAALLSASLPGGLPAGNVLTWFGLLSASASALLFSTRGSFIGRLARVALAISVAWLPGSVLLAGNLSLNFSGTLGTYWLAASGGLLALVVVVLLVAASGALIRWLKVTGAA